ncbi:MAG: FAD-dependent oxidoreductase, partial [Planctomycetota bacterium]
MRRRDFLSGLAIGAGALSVSGSGAFAQGARDRTGPPRTNPGETVEEPARKIPVVAKADVLVVGAGPAGVAAAISAARAGSSTILVERYNHLGGLWTGGLVLPLLATHGTDRGGRRLQVIHGIGGEMARRLADMKMSIKEVDPVVDPEAAKYVMEVMVKDAGVKPLYHCWAGNALLEDDTIKAVLLESKTGRVAVAPKVVVDCTGDGDIAHFAGESYQTMRYHIGLVSRIGNVDRVDRKRPGYKRMQIGRPTPLKSVNWLNMHGESNQDGLDLFNLSRLQQKYRISVWKHMERVRATPGHEELFLLDTASQLGVRVSRILDGQYRLTLEDSMTHRRFDDAIGVSGGWTSVVHGGSRVPAKNRPMWQIPYRSLVPKKTRNLLVAGRCFCFEKSLVEDTRVIGTCLVTGHGAGAAAAVAASSGASVQDIDVARVRKV